MKKHLEEKCHPADMPVRNSSQPYLKPSLRAYGSHREFRHEIEDWDDSTQTIRDVLLYIFELDILQQPALHLNESRDVFIYSSSIYKTLFALMVAHVQTNDQSSTVQLTVTFG